MVRFIAEAGREAQLFGWLWRSCLLVCLGSYLCFSQKLASSEPGPLLTLEEALTLAAYITLGGTEGEWNEEPWAETSRTDLGAGGSLGFRAGI